jgi:hypothetical protein
MLLYGVSLGPPVVISLDSTFVSLGDCLSQALGLFALFCIRDDIS